MEPKDLNPHQLQKTEKSQYCGCLYFSGAALGRVMTELADSGFAKLRLPATHAFVLMTVNGAPGITIGEIAKIHHLAPSTLTRFIEKLETQDYLRREQSGKKVHIFPQSKSLTLQKDLQRCWLDVFDRYVSILGKDRAMRLTSDISDAYYDLVKKKDKDF